MNFIKVETYDQLSVLAADLIAKVIKEKPDCVLGLATGATPVPTYNYIAEQYAQGNVSFKDVKTFNLDEYYAEIEKYCDISELFPDFINAPPKSIFPIF